MNFRVTCVMFSVNLIIVVLNSDEQCSNWTWTYWNGILVNTKKCKILSFVQLRWIKALRNIFPYCSTYYNLPIRAQVDSFKTAFLGWFSMYFKDLEIWAVNNTINYFGLLYPVHMAIIMAFHLDCVHFLIKMRLRPLPECISYNNNDIKYCHQTS
jgi:hypothetical protein